MNGTLSADDFTRRTIERRAIEATIWGIPIVNYDLMFQAVARLGGAMNQIVYWSTAARLEEPDADAQPQFDLPDAVLRHRRGRADGGRDPAGRGRLDHRLADGLLADRVRGCRPGRRRQGRGRQVSDPAAGLRPADPTAISRSRRTYTKAMACCARSSRAATTPIAKAVDYGKRIKLYPLSQADNPPATTFVDAAGTLFDATIPYDVRFFESLDRMVQSQPWIDARPAGDQHAAVARHREGQALRARRGDEGDSEPPRSGSARLLRQCLRELPAVLRGQALVPARTTRSCRTRSTAFI